MKVIGALALLIVVAAVVLATPMPMLALTDGVSNKAVWLDDGERYRYVHNDPKTGAAVEERYLRSNDRLRLASVNSQDASSNQTRSLTIDVAKGTKQTLIGDSSRWSIDLEATFTDSIRVTPERLPVLTALLRGWRP